jgi:hypothetical protein
MPSHLSRPTSEEYPAYYSPYIALVPDGEILDVLANDLDTMLATIATIPADRGTFRYAPEKWSVKEVLGHIIDCERIYTYRALRTARGDQTPLPGFDENAYVPASGANQRAFDDLANEFAHVRRATIAFWQSVPPDALTNRGTANGVTFSVRTLAYLTAGHARHHLQVLHDRYEIS